MLVIIPPTKLDIASGEEKRKGRPRQGQLCSNVKNMKYNRKAVYQAIRNIGEITKLIFFQTMLQ